jgi:antitoxin component of RelBE/YafQ-DinJ toxin-antitoxin module
MPTTQTIERDAIFQKILRLSDSDAKQVSEFIDSLESPEPNEETLEACRELREGRGIKFTSAEEMFANMGLEELFTRIGRLAPAELAHIAELVNSLEEHEPNEETIRAIEESLDPANLTECADVRDMFEKCGVKCSR